MKYNAVTVTQLNKYLKDRFDEDENLNAILVKGEISNFKNHYTGHLYFTLKDENSLIKCIMFKSYAEKIGTLLEKLKNYDCDGKRYVSYDDFWNDKDEELDANSKEIEKLIKLASNILPTEDGGCWDVD